MFLQIYETYKNAGISAPLVILFGFKAAVCLIGVLLNANLVYITWKTKLVTHHPGIYNNPPSHHQFP
jgi:hypothetical protein